MTLRPGPLRLTIENHTDRRVLPNVCVVNDDLKAILSRRRRFLTAKRLLTNQVFREIYRVLKPGGRMQVGDILVHKEVPQDAKDDIELWSG